MTTQYEHNDSTVATRHLASARAPQAAPVDGYVTTYRVAKMDCAAEQQMVRMAFNGIEPAVRLEFDLPGRVVKIHHRQPHPEIERRLQPLALGTTRQITKQLDADAFQAGVTAGLSTTASDHQQTIVLRWLLAINGTLFGIELLVG